MGGMLTHNLLIPLLMIPLLRQLPLPRDVYLTCMIFLACPIASFSVMFPQLTHQDTVFPGQILALSTLSCIITIPLILTLAGRFIPPGIPLPPLSIDSIAKRSVKLFTDLLSLQPQ